MMSEERIRRGRDARLRIWDRLFHGVPVKLDALDAAILCGDPASSDERGAYVTLRACVVLSGSARQAIRCALRVAILYWFSNVGTRQAGDVGPLRPKRSAFRLGEAIGTGMTWDEAVAAMERKPVDFSAYLSLLEVLQEEYDVQWELAFPGAPPASIRVLAGSIGEAPFARQWTNVAREDVAPAAHLQTETP
jgi:hypothetical protein